MLLVSRITEPQARLAQEALSQSGNDVEGILAQDLAFVGLNQADSFFGPAKKRPFQIVIDASKLKKISGVRKQKDEKGGDVIIIPQLPRRFISAIEPASTIHRTHILMNTSMIDEKWCSHALRPYLHPEDEVCVLAFSFFDDTKNLEDWNRQYKRGQGIWYKTNTDVFFPFGLKESQVHWVNYFTDSPEKIRRTIQNSSILMLTGGAPDLMMKRIREFRLQKTLRAFQGVVIGYSAGAMVQLGDYHITPDEDYPDFSWQKGIGWLKDFDVEVHFHHSRIQKKGMNRAFGEKGLPIYAIEEQGGMIVDEQGKKSFFGKVECFDENHPDYGL